MGRLKKRLRRIGTAIGTLGYSEIPTTKRLGQQMGQTLMGNPQARRTEHALQGQYEADLAEMRARTNAIRDDAYGKYYKGELTEGKKDAIDKAADIRSKQAKEALGIMGIGQSSTAQEMQQGIGAQRTQDINEALDKEFETTMKAIGLEGEALSMISAMNREQRQEMANMYLGVMKTLGSLTSKVFAGGNSNG